MTLAMAAKCSSSMLSTLAPTGGPKAAKAKTAPLKSRPNGQFKVVQFSDIQDAKDLDPRTADAMGRILDAEKPDFVVLTGDQVATGGIANVADLQHIIDQIAKPMESRRVPWAMVYGNHDMDGLKNLGIDKVQMLEMYRKHPHNLNVQSPKDVYGVGNALYVVNGSTKAKPVFGLWLFDSNAYAPEKVGGQELGGYDWIHTSQIVWYYTKSVELEKTFGHKIPSLMFFHIGLPELATMAEKRPLVGEKNEPVCPANLNSGLFTAVLDRGDVLGIYVGHDHTDTYEGDYYGVKLGYGGSIGYASYGLDSKDEKVRNRIRGARVFVLDEANPTKYESRYVYADQVK